MAREKRVRPIKAGRGPRAIMLPEPDFIPRRKDFQFSRGTTPYNKEYDRVAYYMTLLGATEAQISQALDIEVDVFSYWKVRHPSLVQALSDGKLKADSEVAYSLFQAAVGYSHPHEVILTNRVQEFDGNGKVIKSWTEPLRVKTVKHYPPNVKAAIKWLTVRRPEIWRESLDINAKLEITHQLDLTEFSTEELETLNKLSLIQSKSKVLDVSHEEYTEEDDD